MKYFNKFFLKGLIFLLPITLTLYILISVFSRAEHFFGGLIKRVLGESLYIPGFGILITFVVITAVGVLVSNFLTGKLINLISLTLEKMPFIKIIYGPLKDLMSLFSDNSKKNKMQKVVFVKINDLGFEVLGLITRDEFSDIPFQNIKEDHVVVYIPMSYMVGGMSVLVHKDQVRESNIPVEKALKLAITGWIKAQD